MTEPQPEPGHDLIGTTLGGKYLIEDILGEGTTGWVYRAVQFPLNREVAVKVMRPAKGESLPSAAARFTREAEVIGRLEHPNTIVIFDFGATADGRLYLVMKYVRGNTLRALLDDQGALSVDRAARVLRQTAGSLAEAHEAGITHRDIKPANIMLTDQFGQQDVVTVVDFGVAKDARSRTITGVGQLIGTPAYMAPEIAGGAGASPASDAYSLGCVFYEMLTGAPPFGTTSAFSTVYKHVNEEAPALPEDVLERVGVGVGRLLRSLLHKQPDYRPKCSVIGKLLDNALAEAGAISRRRERLMTRQRVQAMRRRRAAQNATTDTGLGAFEVPEASGRSVDDLLDEELQHPLARRQRATNPQQTGKARRRSSSRLHLPMFRRPEAQGELLSANLQAKIVVCALGMSQLEFAAPREFMETQLTESVRIGVPGAPVLHGLVWTVGRVMKQRVEDGRALVTIAIEERVSDAYKNVVKYWSLMQRKL